MSVMVDGLAPRRLVQPQILLQPRRAAVELVSQTKFTNRSMLDLRAPQRTQPQLSAVVAQVSAPVAEAVIPTGMIIPNRQPLPAYAWLLAGGVSAAVVAGSVITISQASPAQIRQKITPAATATATPTVGSTAAAVAPAPPAPTVTSTQIQTLLNEFAAQAGAPVYVMVKDLKSGQVASIAPEQTITSASLYKLFVADGIYTLIDNGKLTLSSSVPGTGSNVGDCLHAMITVSDNTCGEVMEGMLGDSKYNSTLAQYGFGHTKFDYPTQTSAGDVATLLERLYNGTLLSPAASDQFLSLLKAQRINNRLPQGLPAGTVFAHKTGDVLGFVHDAGIVYGPKTDYLVVAMTGPWGSPAEAPAKFAELSSKLYAMFNPN